MAEPGTIEPANLALVSALNDAISLVDLLLMEVTEGAEDAEAGQTIQQHQAKPQIAEILSLSADARVQAQFIPSGPLPLAPPPPVAIAAALSDPESSTPRAAGPVSSSAVQHTGSSRGQTRRAQQASTLPAPAGLAQAPSSQAPSPRAAKSFRLLPASPAAGSPTTVAAWPGLSGTAAAVSTREGGLGGAAAEPQQQEPAVAPGALSISARSPTSAAAATAAAAPAFAAASAGGGGDASASPSSPPCSSSPLAPSPFTTAAAQARATADLHKRASPSEQQQQPVTQTQQHPASTTAALTVDLWPQLSVNAPSPRVSPLTEAAPRPPQPLGGAATAETSANASPRASTSQAPPSPSQLSPRANLGSSMHRPGPMHSPGSPSTPSVATAPGTLTPASVRPPSLKARDSEISKADHVRLGIRLIKADLAMDSPRPPRLDPFAAIKCEKSVQYSKAVNHCNDPYWDEFFAFEVTSPAFAVLKIKMMDHMRCFRPALVGEVRIAVQTISDMPRRYNMPTWHELRNRNGNPRGQVQIQIFYVAERVHRPLGVLCCTWNVGNAQPPDDLDPWLSGVKEQEHDLVAIGVQECTYKLGRGPGGGATGQDQEEGEDGEDGAADFGRLSVALSGPALVSRSFTSLFQVTTAGSQSLPSPRGSVTAASTPHGGAPGGGGVLDLPLDRPLRLGYGSSSRRMPLSSSDSASAAAAAGPGAGAGVEVQRQNSAVRTRRFSSLVGPPALFRSPSAARRASGSNAQLQGTDGIDIGFGTGPSSASRAASTVGDDESGSGSGTGRGSGAGRGVGMGQRTLSPRSLSPALSMEAARVALGVGTDPGSGGSGAAAPAPFVERAALASTGLAMVDTGEAVDGWSTQTSGALPLMPRVKSRLGEAALWVAAEAATTTGWTELLSGPSGIVGDVGREQERSEQQREGAGPSAPADGTGRTSRPRAASAPDPKPGPLCEASERAPVSAAAALAAVSALGSVDRSYRGGNESSFATQPSHVGRSPTRDLSTRGERGERSLRHYKSRGVADLAGGAQFRDVWEDHIKDCMGDNYSLVRSAHMGQIRLLLFARHDVYAAIDRVERGVQATGVAGVATNKGGVAIGVRIWDTELCFINSHLAAHQDKVKTRNNNYHDIVKGIRIDPYQMDCLTAYHHVFWVGDLNYRLDWGQQAVTPTESPSAADFEDLVRAVERGRLIELQATDQLKKEMAAKRVMLGFSEGAIEFPPTFKVKRKGCIAYTPQRSPAWTDRVLYRGNIPTKQAQVMDYFCAPTIPSSDHKPVGAIFSVPTLVRHTGGSPGIHLVLTSVKASGLFVVRKRRDSTSSTTSSMPNPSIIIKGPCLESDFITPVVRQTRCPEWKDTMDLALKPTQVKELANFMLLLRVVDHQEGRVVRSGVQNTLARGVLPLSQAAQLAEAGTAGSTTVNIQLEHNGLPAGMLTAVMHFRLPEVEKKKAPAPMIGRRSIAVMSRLVGVRWAAGVQDGRGSGSSAGAGTGGDHGESGPPRRSGSGNSWTGRMRKSLDELRGGGLGRGGKGKGAGTKQAEGDEDGQKGGGGAASAAAVIAPPTGLRSRVVRWSMDISRLAAQQAHGPGGKQPSGSDGKGRPSQEREEQEQGQRQGQGQGQDGSAGTRIGGGTGGY